MSEEEKEAINIIKGLEINMYDGKSQIILGTETKEISSAIYTVLNLIEELNGKVQEQLNLLKYKTDKIQKQEKVIDEMTIYINKNIDVISKDIEGSICCHNKDGKCINRKCVECVKKYFYRKVEENDKS